MPTETAPCPWPILPCGPLPTEEDEQYLSLKAAATDVLWALSGRQFGCCEVSLRPCRRGCDESISGPWGARLVAGEWINLPCGHCAQDTCSCSEVCEVRLPSAVCEIIEVRLDGVVLPETAYRVDNSDLLVRVDGGCWPLCQEMSLPPTEVGTWEITYSGGVPVPAAGQRALGELMSELWKACRADASCCLPKRVQSITRQGISMVMLDPMDFLQHGRTGLYFVDLWLASVNPHGRPATARVMSPDTPIQRVTTWPSVPGDSF